MLRRLTLAVIPLALVAGALAACAEPTRIPPAEPPSASEPLFASDEEALAAAVAAYEEYLAAVDAALADPAGVHRVEDLMVGETLSEFEASRDEFLSKGYTLRGLRALGSSRLQQVFVGPDSTTVLAYFCEDLTDVLLLGSSGEVLTTEDRPNFTVFEVSVEFSNQMAKVSNREFWENAQSC